ncbi:MAG: glycosyltransferase family 2 protein [Oscillospiraceae bacterium]|nr:glycosyltransferase family 2 protein [Oscillospiraceae bacterium]MCL2278579.1 glycosyltransferase family 2 protein [Oscillospiraceae bacterium]
MSYCLASAKVCAGIITYNSDVSRLRENVCSIISQVDSVFIVDNASSNISEIKDSLSDFSVEWTQNSENLGIAGALNQLVRSADKHGYEWILTLDDDSVCSDDMVARLLTATAHYDNIAVISPRIVDSRKNSTYRDPGSSALTEFKEINMCITAGSLTNVKAVLEHGGFNESLFIDHVDHEMCLRLKEHGYKIVKVNSAEIFQEFGAESTRRRFLWKTYTQRGYSPIRVYYHTRNSLFMVRKYGDKFDSRPRYFYFYLIFAFIARFIYEPKRFARLKAFAKGYSQGLGRSVL